MRHFYSIYLHVKLYEIPLVLYIFYMNSSVQKANAEQDDIKFNYSLVDKYD